jgi:hypothetical protein
MKPNAPDARRRVVGAALLLPIATLMSLVSAQASPPEPAGTAANPAIGVQPLSVAEIAAISRSTAVRREYSNPNGASVASALELPDVDERLALHARAGDRAAVFSVDQLGDTDANDISPGDGACADALGTCGLRTAIQEANALPGLDTILLPAGTITLAAEGANEDAALTGDLDVTESLTLRGAGASVTIVDGNGVVTGDRVFHVRQSGGSYITVDFVDLSVRGGRINSDTGGGILAACRSDVVVRGSGVFENFGAFGGGISVLGSGGCPAELLPRMVVYESAVYRNSADSNLAGAGIDHFGGGTLNVINSTVALNVNGSSTASAAGGISVSSNTANVASIRSSTIIGNSAPNAIAHDGAGLRLGTASTTTLIDNVVGFNTFNGGASVSNCGGSGAGIASAGGNVYSAGAVTCPVTANDSTGNGLALAGALSLNPPGQTPTAALFADSAARSSGRSCILANDQRGVERPLRACSSGAYQFVAAPATPEIFANGFE